MPLSLQKGFKLSGDWIYAAALVLLLIFLFGAAIAPGYLVVYSDNQLRHIPTLTMLRDGVEEEIELPATIEDLKANERIVLTGSYMSNKHDSLLVEIEGAKLVLFVDDTEAYSIKGETNTYPSFQKFPSPDVMFVSLPNDDSVKNLRFEYTVDAAKDHLVLPMVYLGENSILFGHLVSENLLNFVLSGVLLVGGLLLIAFTLMILQRIRQISALIWLGIASLLASFIGFNGNGLAIYLITSPNMLYALSIVGSLLFVLPFLQYVRDMLKPTNVLPLRIFQIISGFLVMLLLVLHLLGLVTYAQDELLVYALILLSSCVFVFYAIFEWLAYGNEQARQHVLPAAILLVFTALSYIDRFVINFVRDDSLFQIGILVFVIWATVFGWNNIRRLLDEAERSKQLELEVAAMNSSLDMQRALYRRLSRSTDEVRRVRHDLRHQLSAITGYLQKGNVDGALGYVKTISGGIPDISSKLLCDNFAVNAVAVHYLDMAAKNEIPTDIQLVVPEDLGRISSTDMSIIIGNLFENAIEACQHVDVSERFIRIHCKMIKSRLTMAIDNSFDGMYAEQDGALYSRKRDGRGVGISSVQAVVERYGGAIKVETAGKTFMVSLHVKL